MGRLLYGDKVELNMPDDTLAHLDMILLKALAEDISVQIHVTTGGESDWALLSMNVSRGTNIFLDYFNTPRDIDFGFVNTQLEQIRAGSFLTLPFLIE